jgi:hypothetical protein
MGFDFLQLDREHVNIKSKEKKLLGHELLRSLLQTVISSSDAE